MKIGFIEVTGIKRVVVDHKYVWKKAYGRWLKYEGDVIKGGKSEFEMSQYLNRKYWARQSANIKKGVNKYRLWISGETVNVLRNHGE
jgi:hypothetical protein